MPPRRPRHVPGPSEMAAVHLSSSSSCDYVAYRASWSRSLNRIISRNFSSRNTIINGRMGLFGIRWITIDDDNCFETIFRDTRLEGWASVCIYIFSNLKPRIKDGRGRKWIEDGTLKRKKWKRKKKKKKKQIQTDDVYIYIFSSLKPRIKWIKVCVCIYKYIYMEGEEILQ